MDIDALRERLIRREEAPVRKPLWAVPAHRATKMAAAGRAVNESLEALAQDNTTPVTAVMKAKSGPEQWMHYPEGDIRDRKTFAQYYFHSHPTQLRGGEYGHFHTFIRARGIPEGVAPAALPPEIERPMGRKAICHLVGISMDRSGEAKQLFTVNRWVTKESWYSAADTIALLDRFEVSETAANQPANRWITGMLRLFRPQIEWLLNERDSAIRVWQAGNPDAEKPVWEDRRLEVTSVVDISVPAQIRLVEAAAARA